MTSAVKFPDTIAISAACVAIIGGVASFAGWALDAVRLTDWFATGVTIKVNTAIALTCAGTSLLLIVLQPRRTRIATALALVSATLGAITLFEHITQINAGIDTLLFDEAPGAMATAAPGRMGPPAATSFILLGIALLCLTDKRTERISVALALVVFGIAMLSLVGYWYGAQVMYTVPRLTGIALQTGLLLAVIAGGILAVVRSVGPMKVALDKHDDARALALRLLPAALLIPLATGWLRIQGQQAGYYDGPFGTALRTVVEMALLSALAWWSIEAIRSRDLRRELAEIEREKVERRFRAVLDASAVPFDILTPVHDADGRIFDFEWAYLNAAAARALQRDAASLIGRRVAEVLPGTWDEPALLDHYIVAVTTRKVQEFELHSTANGLEGWYHVVASPFDHHLAVWFADITDRKQQELELRNADRRKDEFLATLAHELRNPLAPIRHAALLARKSGLTDAQRQWSNEVIERQVQHMSLLLDDLLDVSRITRGTLQLRKQFTPIQDIVRSAIETTRPLIDSKKHTLKVHLPASDVCVDVDPLRIAQSIANLLNNAAKYTDMGGEITLDVQSVADVLTVSVTDNGIGIAEEHRSEIFKMFAQVKSARDRSEGGLGIGLALTQGLVELHGGTVTVRSEGLARGSIFTLRLPVVFQQAPAVDRTTASATQPAPSQRILIADDNRDAAQSLHALLTLEGYDVRVAHDGKEALRVFESFAPDVALLDLGMPEADGFEVARSIRRTAPHVLLIAISGWGQQSDREKSAAAGFDHHLTKPVPFAELTGLLRRAQQQDHTATPRAS